MDFCIVVYILYIFFPLIFVSFGRNGLLSWALTDLETSFCCHFSDFHAFFPPSLGEPENQLQEPPWNTALGHRSRGAGQGFRYREGRENSERKQTKFMNVFFA
jgi:hypothetical protein